MSEYQGSESIRYPSCVFNYGNGKLLSIGFEGELYVRKADKDERLERMGRRISELEAENERLRRAGYEIGYHDAKAELGSGTCEWATDVEGVRIDIADTVHMLRSECDGDHEWDDVVIELAYCKHGGDRWIVRGARGEAWACECEVTGHDDELYDESDDWERLPTPWDAQEPDGWHRCPECGCTVGYTELHGGGWSIMMDDYQIPYNNCPECGRPILVRDVEVER